MGRLDMYVLQGRRAIVLPASLVASVLAHLLGLSYVAGLGRLPDPGLELQTPVEVELSLTDLDTAQAPREAIPSPDEPSPYSPAPSPEPEPQPGGGDHASTKVAVNEDAPPAADAGVPDKPKRRRRRARAPTMKPMPRMPETPIDAGVAQDTPPTPEAPIPIAQADNGAMASLRVDMATLRASPYANHVRALVGRLEDAQALISGSNVDPIADLDRLWLASPDLSRDRSVMAGTLQGQAEQALLAARALAARNGQPAPVEQIAGGVRVVPWATGDATSRVLALLDEHTFTIARREDLPRVLQVMGRPRSPGTPARMLKLDADQLAQFDLIGAPHFLRSSAGLSIPRMLQARARIEDDSQLAISANALFSSEQEAGQVLAHLRMLQQRYGGHPLVQLAGLSKVIKGIDLTRDDLAIHLRLRLQPGEAQSLLAALTDSLPPIRPQPVPR